MNAVELRRVVVHGLDAHFNDGQVCSSSVPNLRQYISYADGGLPSVTSSFSASWRISFSTSDNLDRLEGQDFSALSVTEECRIRTRSLTVLRAQRLVKPQGFWCFLIVCLVFGPPSVSTPLSSASDAHILVPASQRSASHWPKIQV